MAEGFKTRYSLITFIFLLPALNAHILVYPFGHCLNSHLLNAERLSEIVAEGGHQVDMLVSTAYSSYEHLPHGSTKNPRKIAAFQCSDTYTRKFLSKNGRSEWNAQENFIEMIGSESWCHDEERTCKSSKCYWHSEPSYDSLKSSAKSLTEKHEIIQKGKINLIHFRSPENYKPVCEYDTLDFMINAPLSDRFDALIDTNMKYCDSLISDRSLMRRLKDSQYSLLVLEAVDPCSRVLADYLDVPFILLVTTGLGHFDSNPRPPSYLPAAIAPFTTTMTFYQRVINLLLKLLYDNAIPEYVNFMEPFQKLKETYKMNTSLSLDDSFKRASLRLVNSDFSIEYPAPIEPDTVLVGGFSVPVPAPLPHDLRNFVEGAKDGVIVFTFGTLVRKYGEAYTKIFLEALSRLPQRVIWRNHEEITNISTIGSNIRIQRWLPQTSLLAHPNTRLFISHCGLNALFEAAHFGVPVLAIPLSGDQFNNAAKIADHLHMGRQMDIKKLTAEDLYQNLVKILNDPVYSQNAKEVADRKSVV